MDRAEGRAELLVGRLDGCYPTAAAILRLWDGQKWPVDIYRNLRAQNASVTDNRLDVRESWTPQALRAAANLPTMSR